MDEDFDAEAAVSEEDLCLPKGRETHPYIGLSEQIAPGELN